MNSLFYPKFVFDAIKKNKKMYYPYIITCILSVLMYYTIHYLSLNKLGQILGLGVFVISFFSVIFIFYTNSFLLKNRTKEFGLYNILGMGKRHIYKLMFYETLIIWFISISVGLILSIIFSKAFLLLFLKVIDADISFGFDISLVSILSVLKLYTFIFALVLLNSIYIVYKSKPIELLKNSKVGEKEPKIKWINLIIGVICLFAGYYLSQIIEDPIVALSMFFIAVILVIIGTYNLFIAGSIAVLKLLKRNKNFYYKTSNFISVSSLIYRMKQNAVGLASICILSTMVLVTLSTTISLYLGLDNQMNKLYPKDISITFYVSNLEEVEKAEKFLKNYLDNKNIKYSDSYSYLYATKTVGVDGNKYTSTKKPFTSSNVSLLFINDLNNYNKITGKNLELNDNEVFLFNKEEKLNSLVIDDKEYVVKEMIDDFIDISGIHAISEKQTKGIVVKDIFQSVSNIKCEINFNLDIEANKKIEFVNTLNDEFIKNNDINGYASGKLNSKKEMTNFYGSLLFVGIFLGFIFLSITVLIIYYKQIQEGYDDKDRYIIMQKVGMDKKMVKNSISKQVLLVFFLPLITAFIHLSFAFKMIYKLLSVLQLKNIILFSQVLICTSVVFSIVYIIVYMITAKEYYKIVNNE